MAAKVLERPLWTCPKCGALLVTRNMWHACGDYSVERFLAGKGPLARALFARFEDLVRACGPVTVAPAKTRVAFMVRVRFAGVSRVSEQGMTCSFELRGRLESPRIQRVEQIEKWFVHTLRFRSPDELDEEVLGWLREAYQVGEQRYLSSQPLRDDPTTS